MIDRVSLGEFERRHGINKGTVSKDARELGYETSQGLDTEAYAAMKEFYGVDDKKPETQEQRTVDVPSTYRAGGLVPVSDQTVTRTVGLFDADSYQQDKQALESNAQNQAASLNDMVAAYAQSRIASVLADIDLVADSVRANALQAMGAQPGKPQSQQDMDAA